MMKSSRHLILIFQILFITSIISKSNSYFGYVRVDGERSSTKLYSVSPMEERFKSIVEKFGNKRSEQLTKNEILRTVQLKNAEKELKNLHEVTKDKFNQIDRALDDFEKLKSDDEMSKVVENLKLKQMQILDYEEKVLDRILNNVNQNNTAENITLNSFKPTELVKILNSKLVLYGELSNNLSLISEKKFQINPITNMKLNLGEELVSNVYEYHKLLDTFGMINNYSKVFNDSLTKLDKLQENIKNIDNNLFSDISVFSTLKFNEIEPKRGELLHDINDPNFNDEKLAKTLMDKMIRNIKEDLMSNVKWVTIYEKTVLLPDNAVVGGNDDEDNKLYVIRKELNHKTYYGKFVRSDTRKNAYITTKDESKGVENFEVCKFLKIYKFFLKHLI